MSSITDSAKFNDNSHYYSPITGNAPGQGVTQITAGTGISVSPVGGTGNVTVSASPSTIGFPLNVSLVGTAAAPLVLTGTLASPQAITGNAGFFSIAFDVPGTQYGSAYITNVNWKPDTVIIIQNGDQTSAASVTTFARPYDPNPGVWLVGYQNDGATPILSPQRLMFMAVNTLT